MDESILDEIAKKYGYDEDMKHALFLCVYVMVQYYGENSLQDILDLLMNVRIYPETGINNELVKEYEKRELKDINKHVDTIDAPSPYGEGTNTGSCYNYEIIYDENMNPISEKTWIIVETKKDAWNGEAFFDTFGTYINFPYLLHELNHAYAMQHPYLARHGDKIVCKHGMYISEYTITNNDGRYQLQRTDQTDLLLEEAIDECITNEMLCTLLGVTSDELKQIFREIHFVDSSYGVILASAANRFINLIGKDKMMAYRRENDDSVLDEYNDLAQSGEIGQKYFANELPFDNFSKNAMKVYTYGLEKYHHPLEEYRREQGKNTCELFGPLYAYQEVKDGSMNLTSYDEYREEVGLDTNVPARI